MRKDFSKDPKLKHWVNFFFNKDELEYWKGIKDEDHLKNLIFQSEAFWPEILKKVNTVKKSSKHAIFEEVNILPHLPYKDLNFPGFFLIQDDLQIMLDRLKIQPRWGKNQKLQKLEAKFFIEWEGKYIRQVAQRYNYPVFNNSDQALATLKQIFEIK